ncbi:MAG TPA: hypothetical protein VKQ71_04300 [Acidimicrobiales bacterium]|nr:hypothetical protein [Acidimicrobiales bacterium]
MSPSTTCSLAQIELISDDSCDFGRRQGHPSKRSSEISQLGRDFTKQPEATLGWQFAEGARPHEER